MLRRPVLRLGAAARLVAAPAVAAVAMAATTARAVPPDLVHAASDEADWEALFALDLLEKLDLSPQQARLILPVYEESCRLYVAHTAQARRLYEQALATWPAYRDQKRDHIGVAREVEETAISAHTALREWQHRYQADRLALEKRLREDVLTQRQQRTADAYLADPQRIARDCGAVGGRIGRDGQDDRGDRDDRLAAPPAAGPGSSRNPDPSSLERRLDEVQAERERLDSIRHPGGGAIAEHLLSPAAAEWFYRGLALRPPPGVREAQQLWRFGTPAYPRSRRSADAQRVQALKDEINDWNLVIALQMTRSQTEHLTGIVAAAMNARGERQAHGWPQAWLDERWVSLEREVQAALTPGQRQALAEFSSCFAGKPSLRNPVRVGQASVADEMQKWLEKVRRMDELRMLEAVRERVEQEEQRWTGPLSPGERRERTGALESAARRARAMSDVDFALDRAVLAESIAPRDRSQELAREALRIRQRLGKTGKAARLMFTTRFLGLLKQRLAMLAAQDGRRPAPVTEGPQAETAAGGCALPPHK